MPDPPLLEEIFHELHQMVKKYQWMLGEFNVDQQILSTFALSKPMTTIEIYESKEEGITITRHDIHSFIDELAKYFFVYCRWFDYPNQQDVHIYLSRFRTLIEIIEKSGGLDDEQADIFGLFCGYSNVDVFKYCQDHSLMHLIKGGEIK